MTALDLVHDDGDTVDLGAARRAARELLDSPRGVGVVIESEHLCMSIRGLRSTDSRTLTSRVTGTLRADARARHAFFALCRPD